MRVLFVFCRDILKIDFRFDSGNELLDMKRVSHGKFDLTLGSYGTTKSLGVHSDYYDYCDYYDYYDYPKPLMDTNGLEFKLQMMPNSCFE